MITTRLWASHSDLGFFVCLIPLKWVMPLLSAVSYFKTIDWTKLIRITLWQPIPICGDRNTSKFHGSTLEFLFLSNSLYVKFFFCFVFFWIYICYHDHGACSTSVLLIPYSSFLDFVFHRLTLPMYLIKNCNILTIPAPNLFRTACQSHHLPRYFTGHKSSLTQVYF